MKAWQGTVRQGNSGGSNEREETSPSKVDRSSHPESRRYESGKCEQKGKWPMVCLCSVDENLYRKV